MAICTPQFLDSNEGRGIEFRSAVPEDADAFLIFQQQIAHETKFTLQVPGRAPSKEEVMRGFSKALEDRIEIRVAAFHEGKMVGLMGIHQRSGAHPWTDHVVQFGMMILKDYWGEGIGRKLLNILEEHAKNKGIHRIEATVRSGNKHGIRLYTKAGFKIEGTREHAALIDGLFYDELYIAKML
jgi:RimJ/RimL family protein N-acetyltransferase